MIGFVNLGNDNLNELYTNPENTNQVGRIDLVKIKS